MKLLLDTHFLLWAVTGAARLDEFGWLERYAPLGVSPLSFLEIRFLAEAGRLEVRDAEFMEAVSSDPRFVVDEAPLVPIVRHALALTWTRDPFDRLLVAHSRARRVPFCTIDQRIRAHHSLVPPELAD